MNFMTVIFESHLVKFQATPDAFAESKKAREHQEQSEVSGEASDGGGDHAPRLEHCGIGAKRWTVVGFMKDEWIKKLSDGRLVQFTYLELMAGSVFITAQIARNEVVYSILLSEVNNPLSRKEVEGRFESELLKK
jgi:hypothetical protein